MKAGDSVYAKKSPGILNIRKSPEVNNQNWWALGFDTNNILEQVSYPRKAGTLSGKTMKGKDGFLWYETKTLLGDFGWVRSDAFSTAVDNKDVQPNTKYGGSATETTEAQIRRYIAPMLANDQYVFESLLVIIDKAVALDGKGKLTASNKARLNDLVKRYNDRQKTLVNSKYFDLKSGYRSQFQPLVMKYAADKVSGIGNPATVLQIARIVIVGVFSFVTLAMVQNLFAPHIKTAEIDRSGCDELHKAIEGNEKAKEELEHTRKENFEQGVQQGKAQSSPISNLFGNAGTMIGLGVLGLILLNRSKK